MRAMIADFIGINSRYLFFKILGYKKTKKHLRGEDIKDGNLVSQHIFNIVVGLIMMVLISLILMYGSQFFG